jgi:DNA modification methylase
VNPYYQDSAVTIYHGDALATLSAMPAESVQCCVTSPPYWGLRDYGVAGQLGLEKTPEEYVEKMVAVFREVRRVLRGDGTLWLNLGDSYAGSWGDSGHRPERTGISGHQREKNSEFFDRQGHPNFNPPTSKKLPGLKPKDLVGIPWRVAFALQADGWYLRSDIIWAKKNCMPESVTDRPTRSHEYIFLLSRSAKYHYDGEAIKEPGSLSSEKRLNQSSFDMQAGGEKDYGSGSNRSCRKALVNYKKQVDKQRGHSRRHDGFNDRWDIMSKEEQCSLMRNKRDVWTVATKPYAEAHFATFPPDLILPMILAGCPLGGVVLDPFMGSGTTAWVAKEAGRKAVGIELNEGYIKLAQKRIAQEVLPL